MRKSAYAFAAVLIASGLLANNGVASAKESNNNNITVCITAAVDEYVANETKVEKTSNSKVSIQSTVENVVATKSNGTSETAVISPIPDAVVNQEQAVGNQTIATSEIKTEEPPIISGGATQEAQAAAVVKYPQFEGKIIPDVEEYLNIREEENEESEAVGKLYAGAMATIVESGAEWTKITSGTVTGYVKNEFILSGDVAGEFANANLPKEVTIATETLKVRAEESVDAECVTIVPEGDVYSVVEDGDEWVKVKIDDETEGYVSKEFVTVSSVVKTAISKEEEEALIKQQEDAAKEKAAKEKAEIDGDDSVAAPATTTAATTTAATTTTTVVSGSATGGRADIVNYALQFVGNPYVYGGTSLTGGADCSGFIMSVFANFGYGLPHSSSAQSNCGTEVALDALQPGDLLFYNNGGGIGHVTMYIGNGQVVHASSSTTGIIVSSVNYRTPCKARRIAN